jgi:hypothetical protein
MGGGGGDEKYIQGVRERKNMHTGCVGEKNNICRVCGIEK